MPTVLYMTTKPIENPLGDGRHNRAKWRSTLDKTIIPAGFVFGIDDEGNIEDRSLPVHIIGAARGERLRKMLIDVASPPLSSDVVIQEETVDDVISTLNDGDVRQVLKQLNLNPQELREMLAQRQGQSSQPKTAPASASPQAVLRVGPLAAR